MKSLRLRSQPFIEVGTLQLAAAAQIEAVAAASVAAFH
ncbi:Hypothetical protein Cul210932_0109 [Corynebacterium ulcerans]|nr:Hypothetical protein Cul210932_0109 [Corynebacterium ulcerans]